MNRGSNELVHCNERYVYWSIDFRSVHVGCEEGLRVEVELFKRSIFQSALPLRSTPAVFRAAELQQRQPPDAIMNFLQFLELTHYYHLLFILCDLRLLNTRVYGNYGH